MMQFTCGEQPQLVFTWGSEFPDKVKLRKLVTVWPLRFKLRLDYTSATRAVEFGCSCKVRFPWFSVDIAEQEAESVDCFLTGLASWRQDSPGRAVPTNRIQVSSLPSDMY